MPTIGGFAANVKVRLAFLPGSRCSVQTDAANNAAALDPQRDIINRKD